MKESEFKRRLSTSQTVLDSAAALAREAGAKFDREGPPIVPRLGVAVLSASAGAAAGWCVTAHTMREALSNEQANEIVRRATEERWRRLLELAQVDQRFQDEVDSWPVSPLNGGVRKVLGAMAAIRRVLEGEE